MSLRKKLIELTNSIDSILLAVSGVFLLFVMSLTTMNTVLRYFNLGAITWTEEACTHIMVLMIFIALPSLEFRDKQLCISILQGSLKNDTAKRTFHIVRGVVTLILSSVALYYYIVTIRNAFKYGFRTQVLLFPRGYLYIVVSVGFVFVIISWLVTIFAAKGKVPDNTVNLGVVDESIIEKNAAGSLFTADGGDKEAGAANDRQGQGNA